MNVTQVHADDTELLDAIYHLHSTQWQPKWRCADEAPYPTRAMLDFYAAGDFRIFVTSGTFPDYPLCDAYAIFNAGGKLLWAFTVLARGGLGNDTSPVNQDQLAALIAASVAAGAQKPSNRLPNPYIDASWDSVLARADALIAGG